MRLCECGQPLSMAFGRKRKRTDGPDETLFDSSGVDVISVAEDDSLVELHIVVDHAWTGSDEQITSLQQKINTYVSFAVDGQLAATFPEVNGLPWRVVVRCHVGLPDARTSEVLEKTRQPVQSYGGDLVVRA